MNGLIHQWEHHLATVIDEMLPAWNSRFEADNRLPHVFDEAVTGSVDTFPIEICRPSDGSQREYFNGKYKKHVVKVSLYRYTSLGIDICCISKDTCCLFFS